MKTLQIGVDWFPEWGIGGLERYYYDLTRYLPSVGVETVGLVTGSVQVLQEKEPKIYGFSPRDSSILERLFQLRKLTLQLLKEDNYSLIASHFALYTCPIVDELRKRPFVVHFHGPWAIESVFERSRNISALFRNIMEQAIFKNAQAFIVLSEAYKIVLNQQFGVPLEKIYIVPGGVETSRFDQSLSRSDAREKLGWPQDRMIIFTARRLSKRMGLDNLISAMQDVCRRYSDVLVLIAGKGELQETLQNQIEMLCLTNHVRLLGNISDQHLDLAYKAADLSVIPTLALEGFGLIALESLAAGTPILGTPVGGIPEILRPFSENLVFDGYESEDLRQGILEVLSGERKLPSQDECVSYIQQNYTWPTITQRIKSIYENIIHEY